MRKLVLSLIQKSYFLTLTCMFLLNINAWSQEKSLATGINEGFKQQPEQWIEQFNFSSSDLVNLN